MRKAWLALLIAMAPAAALAQLQTAPVAICDAPLRLSAAGGVGVIDDLTTCYGRGDLKALKDDVDAIQAVDRRFRTLITTGSYVTVDTDTTFRNRPLTRLSFGAGTAMLWTLGHTRPRARLADDKTLAADPLPRALTMAFLNYSPRGYDDGAPDIQPAERCRVFFGASLTPDFGLVSGVNVLLVRGLGVSVGVGALFGKGADEGELGAKPPDTADQFKLSTAGVVFLGITYNFK